MIRNQGLYIFCGVVCVWPLIVASIGIWLDRRIRTHGIESLMPWRKQA
jgi:hypothetical protein